MAESPVFLFFTCQAGAELALKSEVANKSPLLKFAYSRPGFVTFKCDSLLEPQKLDVEELPLVFARTAGFSLGQVTGETVEARLASVWELAAGPKLDFDHLHVWERESSTPESKNASPHLGPFSLEVKRLLTAFPSCSALLKRELAVVRPGDRVLDVVLVTEGEWWVGYHRVNSETSKWPGGCVPIELPADAVSRAYFKMEEALRWSGLPVRTGQTCVEIGSAPGGAAQSLLNRGLHLVGIDPAEMHPQVLKHVNFRHVRRRSKEVTHKTFRGVDWLAIDVNLPPNYTLDTLEGILHYPGVSIQGLLVTLKLRDWSLVTKLPDYLARVNSWGFQAVRAKQLFHNRQEVCVVGSKSVNLFK